MELGLGDFQRKTNASTRKTGYPTVLAMIADAANVNSAASYDAFLAEL